MVQLGDIPNEAEERGAIQKERAFEDRGTGIRVLGGTECPLRSIGDTDSMI